MWNKNSNEEDAPVRSEAAPPRQRTEAPRERSGSAARIGPQSRFQGEVGGSEDLIVEGHLEGKVHLEQSVVTVAASGELNGDVFAERVVVEGTVRGNLHASNEIVVTESGVVEGNLHTPRVTLRDGCRFQGSVDMGKNQKKAAEKPSESKQQSSSSSPEKASEAKGGKVEDRQPVAANA